MAKRTLKQFGKRQFGGAAGCYGNTTTLHFKLTTNSSGGALDADDSTALAIADVVDMGPLPEGMRLDDLSAIVSVGMTASVTGSFGFAYADGVDDTSVPQDAAYFGTGLALNSAARLRANAGKALVVLPKPARLILTIAGANNAKASAIDVLVTGELQGDR